MVKALLAALFFSGASAFAQSTSVPDGGTPAAETLPKPAARASEADDLRREMEAKLEAAKKEMREEMQAQQQAQSATQGWEEEVTEEKRKLELFVPNGYFRVRPELYHKFDLGRGQDTAGYWLYPHSQVSAGERTIAGVNMRFRFEPTLNVSEEVRIKMQVDALDNVVFGSTPDYGYGRWDRDSFSLFVNSQAPPTAGLNSFQNSVVVKRVYGEVSTPVWGGIMRFGRMGSHWGLGMLHNDGNCLDCDRGDTVDRLMFVAEPFNGWFIAPMIDYNAVGPTTVRVTGDNADPLPLSNQDASLSFILAIARRDVEQQAKAKLQNNQAVFNYGLYFEYRSQKFAADSYYFAPQPDPNSPAQGTPDVQSLLASYYVPRYASIFIPDIWVKYERRNLRLELEAATELGSIQGSQTPIGSAQTNRSLSVTQLGAVAQGEYRLVDGALHLGLEMGYASGDRRPGVGNHQGRRGSATATVGSPPQTVRTGDTAPGDIDGPRFCIHLSDDCQDSDIKNFRFNPDYHVDMILWRQLLGGVTAAVYAKPSIRFDVTEGFSLFGAAIYSRAIFPENTPSGQNTGLGIEFNAGARYETDDGFFAQFMYGVLFPLAGLKQPSFLGLQNTDLDTAQALRGMIGIRF